MPDNAVKLAMFGEIDPEMPILVRFLFTTKLKKIKF